MPLPRLPLQDGVDDSKQLSEEQREALYAAITSHPRIEWAVCLKDHTVIDDVNILQATLRAMEGAVAQLATPPDRVLIDGNRMPPALAHNSELIVGGDAKSFAIGAASVLAKVTRDRLMLESACTWLACARHRFCVSDTRRVGPSARGSARTLAAVQLRAAQRIRHAGAHGGHPRARALPDPQTQLPADQGHGGCKESVGGPALYT